MNAAPAVADAAHLAVPRLDDPMWQERHEIKLREAQSKPVDVLLLGDSITQNYELAGPDPLHDYRAVWQRYYADRHVLNLGFNGDGSLNLLWRLRNGEIDGLAPQVAVVLIGTNDIGWLCRTADQTVDGINAVVAELQRRLPKTMILLVGILPSDRPLAIRQAADRINARLAARYGQGAVTGIVYQDVSSAFLVNGVVDVSLFADPREVSPAPALHPSPEGQARMAAMLEPALCRLLGDARHD